MFQEILEEVDNIIVYASHDERGRVVSFTDGAVANLHAASMKPGAIRGNHTHEYDEIICIMGGDRICAITVEESSSGIKEQIQVDENIKTYRIKAGVIHTVQNIGEHEFYLISFLTKGEDGKLRR